MNFVKVLKYICSMLQLEAILMLLPFLVSLYYKEKQGNIFLILAILIFILSTIFKRRVHTDYKFFSAEGFVTASVGWIVLSIFGAIPFVVSKVIPNFIDALFETVSGFSTTGATIITNVELIPHCFNFWRCLTHFVGGMGVLVLMLAIIPTKSETMSIMKAESPGPQVGKLVPKVADTARVLYIIYIFLTLFAILCYKVSGMPLFDSICIGLGTAGTGGFVITQNGCSDYSEISQLLIAIFMLLFGVNFNIYYYLLLHKFKLVLKSEEFKAYLFIIFISVLLITLNILHLFNNINLAIHNSLFQVVSIITTTGFSICDYTTWPILSKCILLILMVVGGCAGSTAGGFKVSRIIISIKLALNELYLQLHPNSVKVIKFEDKELSSDIIRTLFSYTIIYILIIVVGTFLISFENLDFETTISSVLETFNNIGLGLSMIGPKGNFSIFSSFSKVIFIILMLTGRLEIFPIMMLFSKNTWRRES